MPCSSEQALKNSSKVLFLLALAQTVTPNCAMPFFIDDRQYYTKESAARLYGALPYHLANAASEAAGHEAMTIIESS